MISVPDELLARIDGEARRRELSRSGFLRAAALRELAGFDREAMLGGFDRARERLDLPGFEAAEEIRADRAARDERDRSRR